MNVIEKRIVVRADNDNIKSFDDLKGKTTANSISSTYMMLAESYGAETKGVDTLDETMMMVLSGRVDATLNANVSFYDYMRVHPDAPLKEVAQTDKASLVCIPIRKGAEFKTLKRAIDAAIEALRTSGELKSISEKYFGSDISGTR